MFRFFLLVFIQFFSLTFISAQQYRFLYKYQSIPDTLKRDSIVEEEMILDIQDNKSLFFSKRKFISDSTMQADAQKGLMTMPDSNIRTRYIIKKTYPDLKSLMITDEFSTIFSFEVLDDRVMDWKLLPEKKMIKGYECQKAELDFGGRHWVAWFAEKIPFNDGPYKFKGLPGLILEIEDSKENHIFLLQKIEKRISQNNIYESENLNKKRKLSLTEFSIFYKEFRKDPIKEFRQRAMSGEIYYESEEKKREHIIQVEKLRKERIRRDNNIIEINLL